LKHPTWAASFRWASWGKKKKKWFLKEEALSCERTGLLPNIRVIPSLD
jgi:hypothetical protein